MNQWSENYGIHRLDIGLLSIVVAYKTGGYSVSVTGCNRTSTLKARFNDVEEGKRAGLALARRKMVEALDELDVFEGIRK